MPNTTEQIWLAGGLRTPFVEVDGPFAKRDLMQLSVPVVQALAARSSGKIDFGVWGAVVQNLAYANLAREIWLEAKLDPHVPTFTTVMQCSTSMVAAFEAAGMLGQGRAQLAMVGGVESMTRVQIGLSQDLSDWLRRLVQARRLGDASRRAAASSGLRDIRLYIPEVKNRVTGQEHGRAHRGHGQGLEDRPRGAGRARAAEPPARGRGAGSRLLRRPDHPRRRRDKGPLSAPRHLAGEARQAAAGIRPHQRPRHADRRQLARR